MTYIKYFGKTKHYCMKIGEVEICSLSEKGLRETVKIYSKIMS